MTSIEWLALALYENAEMKAEGGIIDQIVEEAKKIHYKELMDSMQRGMELQEKENNRIGFRERNGLLPKQETFVSKKSDDHIADISKMVNFPQQVLTKKQVIEILNDIDYHYDLKGDSDWLMNEIINRLDNIKDTPELPQQETLYTEEQVREELIGFQIYLNNKGLITNHDWDFEKIAKKYIKSLKQPKKD